jgi:hypothetical protein
MAVPDREVAPSARAGLSSTAVVRARPGAVAGVLTGTDAEGEQRGATPYPRRETEALVGLPYQ